MKYAYESWELPPDAQNPESSRNVKREGSRIAAWHATFNAAVGGLAANGCHPSNVVLYATQIADETHGKL